MMCKVAAFPYKLSRTPDGGTSLGMLLVESIQHLGWIFAGILVDE